MRNQTRDLVPKEKQQWHLKLPTNGGLFIGLVTKMIKGIIDLGPSVPVTMVTAEELESQLELFKGKE